MGFEITPKGIMIAMAVIVAVIMAVVNRSQLLSLATRLKPTGRAAPAPVPAAAGSTPTKGDVLKLLNQLSEFNDTLKLGIGIPLDSIYSKLVISTDEMATQLATLPQVTDSDIELDVWDHAKFLGNECERLGIDIREQMQAIYATLVEARGTAAAEAKAKT